MELARYLVRASSSFLQQAACGQRSPSVARQRRVISSFRRARRFRCGAPVWLQLEFSFQLLNQRGQLLLSFSFYLLPQRLFHSAALLHVARFELSALLLIQRQPGVTQCRVGFALNLRTAQAFPLAQEVALFRAHPHPTLGVAAEILAGGWRERKPALLRALHRRRTDGARSGLLPST